MCEARMLHGRVIVQTLRWIVENAIQELQSKFNYALMSILFSHFCLLVRIVIHD